MVSGKKRKEAEPATASGTKLGRRNQLGQAELAWTGGGARPNPPTPPQPTGLMFDFTCAPINTASASKVVRIRGKLKN